MSFSGTESGASSLQQNSFAMMVAAGITVCASSGDGGSRPNFSNNGFYSLSQRSLSVSYPASDQNVIGVGGTTIAFNINAGYTDTGEVVWFQPPLARPAAAEALAPPRGRPSWQAGIGRCPPIRLPLRPRRRRRFGRLDRQARIFGAFIDAQRLDRSRRGGTSLSVQVFGGLLALINQARATNGQGSLGALGPSLYPLNPANGSTAPSPTSPAAAMATPPTATTHGGPGLRSVLRPRLAQRD